MKFRHKFYIKSSIERVYDHLYNIKNWPSILPHCKKVEIIEETGKKQHLFMEIKTKNKVERIETLRRCEKNRFITFHQLNPPKPLIVHDGIWLFEEYNNAVKVISMHEIKVKSSILSFIIPVVSWCIFIKPNSIATLKRIKEILEKN